MSVTAEKINEREVRLSLAQALSKKISGACAKAGITHRELEENTYSEYLKTKRNRCRKR